MFRVMYEYKDIKWLDFIVLRHAAAMVMVSCSKFYFKHFPYNMFYKEIFNLVVIKNILIYI